MRAAQRQRRLPLLEVSGLPVLVARARAPLPPRAILLPLSHSPSVCALRHALLGFWPLATPLLIRSIIPEKSESPHLRSRFSLFFFRDLSVRDRSIAIVLGNVQQRVRSIDRARESGRRLDGGLREAKQSTPRGGEVERETAGEADRTRAREPCEAENGFDLRRGPACESECGGSPPADRKGFLPRRGGRRPRVELDVPLTPGSVARGGGGDLRAGGGSHEAGGARAELGPAGSEAEEEEEGYPLQHDGVPRVQLEPRWVRGRQEEPGDLKLPGERG